MPYCNEIAKALDRDGELPVCLTVSMSDDITLYVRESDLIEMVGAGGYTLVKTIAPTQEGSHHD